MRDDEDDVGGAYVPNPSKKDLALVCAAIALYGGVIAANEIRIQVKRFAGMAIGRRYRRVPPDHHDTSFARYERI